MNPTTTTTLANRIETVIRRLREVEEVSVQTEGDEVREIHVLTSSERPPKNIARDVQSAIRAALGLAIDHRVVSVALAQKGAGAVAVESAVPEPAAFDTLAEPVAAPSPDRIQFEGVNLFVSGPRTQAQVELRWKGLPRIGSAAGWSARDESHRLVAQAAAAAVQEFLADPVALNVQGVEFETFGRIQVAVVAVSFVAHRQEKMLTGSCAVAHDTPQAVVLATLDALNRVVGGLRVKEPTEYVLRPTSG